jgi:hypothetical protein
MPVRVLKRGLWWICSTYYPWNQHAHRTKIGAKLCQIFTVPKEYRQLRCFLQG